MKATTTAALLLLVVMIASSTAGAFQGVAPGVAPRRWSSSSAASSTGLRSKPVGDSTPDEAAAAARTIGDRRQALGSFVGWAASMALVASTTAASPGEALALDMDAFVSSQIESDTKNCDPKKDPKCLPKLTEDAALCKYGQSGEARAAACKRYKASGGALPAAGAQGKSLGGAYAM